MVGNHIYIAANIFIDKSFTAENVRFRCELMLLKKSIHCGCVSSALLLLLQTRVITAHFRSTETTHTHTRTSSADN